MRHWQVERSWAVESSAAGDSGYAHTYVVAPVKGDADDRLELTIQFDGTGSPADAALILRPFLEREARPPRRVLVARDGSAAVCDD